MEQKRNWKPVIIVAVLFVFVIGMSVWQTFKTPKGDIKIAYVSSLSGDAGVWGQSMQKGFDFALNEINANGGINGRKITVVYEDDKCDASTGVTAFNKVIDIDGAKYITGTVCSSVAMSVAKKTQENRVLYVASGATSPEVPKQGDLIFSLWSSDTYDALETGKYVVNDLGFKKLAGIYSSDIPAGTALKNAFKESVLALGGQIISEEMIDSRNKDVKTSVQKMIIDNPEGVYVGLLPEQSILVIKQLKSLGYEGKIFVYSASAASEGYASKVKNKENVFYASPVTVQETNFWNDYKTKTGTDADLLVSLGYDSMKMIEYGVSKCGEDNNCIRDTFLSIKNYQISRGKIYFDQYGAVNGLKYEIKAL